jgi:hypothetical protein
MKPAEDQKAGRNARSISDWLVAYSHDLDAVDLESAPEAIALGAVERAVYLAWCVPIDLD